MSKSPIDLTEETPEDLNTGAIVLRESPTEHERVKKREAVATLNSDRRMLKRFNECQSFIANITFVDSYINHQLISSDGIDSWWRKRIGHYSETNNISNTDAKSYNSPDSVLCREACLDLLQRKSKRGRLPRFFKMSDEERCMAYLKNFDDDMTEENPAFYSRIGKITKLFRNQLLLPANVRSLEDVVRLVADVVIRFGDDDVEEAFNDMNAIQRCAYLANVLIESGSEEIGSDRWPELPLCYYVSKMEAACFSHEPQLIQEDRKMKWDETVWRYKLFVFGYEGPEMETDSPLFEQIISIAASFHN